jgi:hypothetical protein
VRAAAADATEQVGDAAVEVAGQASWTSTSQQDGTAQQRATDDDRSGDAETKGGSKRGACSRSSGGKTKTASKAKSGSQSTDWHQDAVRGGGAGFRWRVEKPPGAVEDIATLVAVGPHDGFGLASRKVIPAPPHRRNRRWRLRDLTHRGSTSTIRS